MQIRRFVPTSRLVIERHGETIIVGHYFEQNGDLMSDPEVETALPGLDTGGNHGVAHRAAREIHRTLRPDAGGQELPPPGCALPGPMGAQHRGPGLGKARRHNQQQLIRRVDLNSDFK